MYPHLLRLDASALRRQDAIGILVSRALRPPRSDRARVLHDYAFKCDEHGFARALLGARTQLWLYRCNQRAACGDFVVVDVSSPWPKLRTAWVLELKRSAVLRFGVGGIQLADAEGARAQLVRQGVLDPDRPLVPVLGQGPEILRWFGAG